MVSVYIENYGCTANYDDGAIMAGLLLEANHNIVKDVDEADVIVINSCAVKNVTVNRISTQIEKLNYKKMIITGCMPVSENERLNKIAPNASLVSSQNIVDIVDVVNKVFEGEQIVLTNKNKKSKVGLPKYTEDKFASIQISQGCKSFCRFCSTKLAKGDLVSYSKEEIVNEVKKYFNLGYKRINLTSTDNGCYGFELGYNLADLLNEIVKINGEFTIRVGMANPQHLKFFTDKLVECYKNNKIMKFLHIPVQAGSNKVLKEMRRDYTIEEFKEIVNKFRKEIPGITISTDIIVGYPTETEEDFNETVKLVEELKFEVMNISKFALRPGTYASKLKQLPTQEIKKRSTILTEVYNGIKNNLSVY